MPPRVCATVVTFDRAPLLRAVLDALRSQTRAPDAILVVDNASSDGTAELLAASPAGLDVLRLPRNVGGAGGFAAAVDWARSRGFDWVWLMDDDVAPEPGCLAELLDVAAETGKRVVAPRRRALSGADCVNEAVLLPDRQEVELVRLDPARERHRAIDLFTFEGPLLHRSVIAAVGLPEAGLFIRGDDMLYAVRIHRLCGPLSCAFASRAVMQKLVPPAPRIHARSTVKRWLTGDDRYEVFGDADHWKLVYALRNRHLMWRELSWHRRRRRLLLSHLVYIPADLVHALRHGWSWAPRLRWNVVSWILGLLAREDAFLDPKAYRAELAAARGARGEAPVTAAATVDANVAPVAATVVVRVPVPVPVPTPGEAPS